MIRKLAAAVTVAAMTVLGFAAPAAASPAPARGTPELARVSNGAATATVSDIDRCGNHMFIAGQFLKLRSHGKVYDRRGAASFAAGSPYGMTKWNPSPGQSQAIALNGSCTRAWIATRRGIDEVAVPSGRKIRFISTGGQVNALMLWGGHLFAGGQLPGSPLYSLNPATGRHDGFFDPMSIKGSEPPAPPSPSKVWHFQLSPNKKRLLVEGNFTSVSGQGRRQIFMLNLDHHPYAQLTPWYSTMFNGECIPHEAYYVRDAAWSPDGRTIYIATTGDHEWPKMTIPHTGLCDLVAAFPDKWQNVGVLWRNYFGCDSGYAVGFAGGMVFVGGHFRWVQNRRGCDKAGPGAIPYPGLAAFTPAGHPVLTNGHARYSMSRANADDMLTVGGKLWVASTNRFRANDCDGVPGHRGICAIPVG